VPKGTTINQIPPEKSIGSMLLSGELHATSLYFDNIANIIDRNTVDLKNHPDLKPVFPDIDAECARYFSKTGIFPINHAMVLRRSLFEKYPWAALSIYQAMLEANEIANRERIAQMQYHLEAGTVPASYRKAIMAPIVQHGLRANRMVLETAMQYSFEQGLTPRLVKLDEIFAPSTLGE
jgi:4,5-dihydroxyphthalate decarboxylase